MTLLNVNKTAAKQTNIPKLSVTNLCPQSTINNINTLTTILYGSVLYFKPQLNSISYHHTNSKTLSVTDVSCVFVSTASESGTVIKTSAFKIT